MFSVPARFLFGGRLLFFFFLFFSPFKSGKNSFFLHKCLQKSEIQLPRPYLFRCILKQHVNECLKVAEIVHVEEQQLKYTLLPFFPTQKKQQKHRFLLIFEKSGR